MLCREVMNRRTYVCDREASVSVCARIMRDHDLAFVPVVNTRMQVVGTITDHELVEKVLADARSANLPIARFMRPLSVSCRPVDPVDVARDRMVASGLTHLPVLDEGERCVGVISHADLGYLEHLQHLEELVRDANVRGPRRPQRPLARAEEGTVPAWPSEMDWAEPHATMRGQTAIVLHSRSAATRRGPGGPGR
ncbi:MAG: CBS domain-containing protein [Deltaproteobacteria bacterium]|nr:CBS domain-containing protein [Deltaproteobacteria bacterium]